MGLFTKKDACVAWLTKVDQAYLNALRSKNTSSLSQYFDRKCLSIIAETIRRGDDVMHGLERYREVTFTLQETRGEYLKYLRSITFSHVKMGYGVTIPVGDDTQDFWILKNTDGRFIIVDMKGA